MLNTQEAVHVTIKVACSTSLTTSCIAVAFKLPHTKFSIISHYLQLMHLNSRLPRTVNTNIIIYLCILVLKAKSTEYIL